MVEIQNVKLFFEEKVNNVKQIILDNLIVPKLQII